MKHTKAILSSALALALTAGISATVWAANTTPPVNPSPVVAVDFEPEASVKEYSCLADTLTSFDLAALMGEAPEDPMGRTYPIEHKVEIQDSDDSKAIKLTRNIDVNAYNCWTSNFVVPDDADYSVTFSEPESFKCAFNGSAKTVTIRAKTGYEGNYKSVRINYTIEVSDGNGGKQYIYDYVEASGNGANITAKINYSGSGKLVEASCFYTLRSGTGASSTIRDYASVHFVEKSYSKTAAFAAEPYAKLLDEYTVIPDELC